MLAKWLVALLASLPILLFAYLGQFSRMMGDDYARFATAMQLGGRINFLYWWNTWDGSFSGILFHDVIVPLGAPPHIPRVFPSVVMALWWVGLFWLIWLALAELRIRRNRILISVVLASLTAGAAVNAFYTWESIYWYTACVDNTLPVGGLLIYLACVFVIARRPRARRFDALAAAAGSLGCLVIGGFSEMYVALQFVYLSLLLAGIYVFDLGSQRKSIIVFLAAGWCGSLAALLLQLSAPGVSYRISSAASGSVFQPIRTAGHLVLKTFETSLEYIGHPGGIVGFALMLAAGLALALTVCRTQVRRPRGRNLSMARGPLALGLLMQVGYIPFLWHSLRDNAALGETILFASAVALTSAILSFAMFLLMILRRQQIEAWLGEYGWRLVRLAAGILCFVLALAAFAQLPRENWTISGYLFATALVWLGGLLALLLSCEDEEWTKLVGRAAILAIALNLVSIVVPIVTGLYFNGVVYARVMSSTALIQALAGLVWGLCIGVQMQRVFQWTQVDLAWLNAFKAASTIVVVGIALGVVANQARLIPDFATYAREWDERHQHIIQARESGEREIEVAPLSFDLSGFIAADGHAFDSVSPYFYRVESIVIAEDLAP